MDREGSISEYSGVDDRAVDRWSSVRHVQGLGSFERVHMIVFALSLATVLIIWCVARSATASADVCPNEALRTGVSANLPDCRAYEQVSPAEKNGSDAFSFIAKFPAQASVPQEGAPDESSLAYMSFDSFSNAAGGDLPPAYLGSRSASGWHTQSLAPPTFQPPPSGGNFLGYDFSADLSQVIIKVPWQILTPDAPVGVYNLYIRHPDGSYSLVTTASPSVNPPPNCGSCGIDELAFAGASADFSHVLFETNDSLMQGAPGGGVENLYESANGNIKLVGILPDGTIAANGATAGAGIFLLYSALFHFLSSDIEHAISQDGSRVIFQALADGGTEIEKSVGQEGMAELYDRLDGSQTVEISAPTEGARPANPTAESAQFRAASANGSLVFFTSSAELTTGSNTGAGNVGQDLYRYDVDTRSLVDLTADPNPVDTLSGAEVQGVVGASSDGSTIYFVAKGQLVPGQGIDGQPNLYISNEGSVEYIATLNEEMDSSDWTSVPGKLQAYVTPDGHSLAFMSVNNVTGYNNRDRSTGQADSEVYVYNATTKQLICASCDPNGAQPIGSAFIGASLNSNEEISTPFHQPRVLSDDGSRLFFTSPDQLTAGSANSNSKIFEYEGGRVYLISSGAGEANDVFLDASPSGNDVFFATRDRLASTDNDDLIDIYDARVDGGFPALAATAPCVESACQGPPPASPSLLTPSSMSFGGPGNLAMPSTTSVKKAKKSKPKGRARGKKRPRRKTKSKRSKVKKGHRAAVFGGRRSR